MASQSHATSETTNVTHDRRTDAGARAHDQLLPDTPGIDELSPESRRAYLDVRDALVFAHPLITTVLFQDAATDVLTPFPEGHPVPYNRFFHDPAPVRAEDHVPGGPNMDVAYSYAPIRLGEQAVLFHKPATDRFYTFLLLNAYGDYVTVVGSGESDPHAPHDVALVGPGFRGSLPTDVERIDVPTARANALLRIQVRDDADDLLRVHELQRGSTLRELGEPVVTAVRASGRPRFSFYNREHALGVETLLNLYNAAVSDNPPLPEDAAYARRFERYGIGADLVFGLDIFEDEALVRLLRELPSAVFAGFSSLEGRARGKTGWERNPDASRCNGDYVLRASSNHFVVAANPPESSIYYSAKYDANGDQLAGGRRYRVRFAPGGEPGLREDGYWSIIPYAIPDLPLIENGYGRYKVGSESELAHNEDGTLDVFVQPEPPADERLRENWVPAGDDGKFLLVFRVYTPDAKTLAGWEPPAVEPLD